MSSSSCRVYLWGRGELNAAWLRLAQLLTMHLCSSVHPHPRSWFFVWLFIQLISYQVWIGNFSPATLWSDRDRWTNFDPTMVCLRKNPGSWDECWRVLGGKRVDEKQLSRREIHIFNFNQILLGKPSVSQKFTLWGTYVVQQSKMVKKPLIIL